ncbi:MAG: hypothetical protein JSU94_13760 [Phycisphaerales bacterium]|nr:MAG: hypothetical protein JSU94_13760 [Phycisphaerales bacterium]
MRMNPLEEFLDCFEPLRQEWVEVEGCIVRGHRARLKRREVKRALNSGMNREEVEKNFNHCHMSMELEQFGLKNSKGLRKRITELFVAVVDHRLRKEFAGNEFIFEIWHEADDTIVTYYQKRK